MWRVLNNFCADPSHLLKNVSWRLSSRSSSSRHIFVYGAPRSGTTLTRNILASHPNCVAVTREQTGIFRLRNLFAQGRFAHLAEDVLPEKIETMLAECSDLVEFYDRFAARRLANTGKIRFVDKVDWLSLDFALKHFPEARVINIVRDPRDSLCSAKLVKDVILDRNAKSYARVWVRFVEARRRHEGSSCIFDVRYEDFTKDPAMWLEKMMLFVGETMSEEQLSPENYKGPVLHTKKQHENLGAPISASSQERWRKELSPEEVADIESVAGHLMEGLGYPLSRSTSDKI